MKNFNLIFAVIFIVIFCSCSKSIVYSPSLNFPVNPLKEKEIDLQAGFELQPEARPEILEGRSTTAGFNAQIGYGFSDRFNLSVKGWGDIEQRENSNRYGFAISAQIIKPLTENNYIIFIPRAGTAVVTNNLIAGYGVGTSVIYQHVLRENMSFYAGPGIIWGFNSLNRKPDAENERKLQMGLAITGNTGISMNIINHLRLNAEVNPVYQINTFENNRHFIVSPQIGIGYTFQNSN